LHGWHSGDGMWYRIAADAVVIIHLGFVAFVMVGGLLALRWPRLVFVHLPAMTWGILIEFFGWTCPLTPLENTLRKAGGMAGYTGGFVEQYLIPVMYPAHLTRAIQVALGLLLLISNVPVYVVLLRRWGKALHR
jgi:hypothetical protein